jgi:hypothetical protein
VSTPTPASTARAHVMVSSPAMTFEMCSTETAARRWAARELQHDFTVLCHGGTPKAVARALSVVAGNIGTLSRRSGGQLNLGIPAWEAHKLGWQAGMRVLREVTPDGKLVVQAARLKDLPDFARPAVEAADRIRREHHGLRQRFCYELRCEQCHGDFYSPQRRCRFCDACHRDRARAASRVYWQRKGKLTPSYQRKLNPRVPAEEIPAPAVA